MEETDVKKEEVEEILGCKISTDHFCEALSYAKRKQQRLYGKEKRNVILQHWYLVQLTKEAAINIAFAEFTANLCGVMKNMEKEHSVRNQSALNS